MFETEINYKNKNLIFYTHDPKKDKVVSREIVNNKVWEPYLSNIWINQLLPGDIAVDIGANIGWYSKLALLSGAEVYSFEPDKRSFSILEKNCPQAHLYNVCLGDTQTDIMFNINEKNFGDSRLTLKNNGIPVKQITLDEIIFEKADRIKAIKIDVQGWEPYVIAGAQKTLSKLKPGTLVLLEFCPQMLKNNNFDINCLNQFFSLFSKSYAFTNSNPDKFISIEEMISWGYHIIDDTQFADTVNVI